MLRSTIAAAMLAAGFNVAAQAQTAPTEIKSRFCRNLYAQMKSKPPAKAMALSTDGKVCNAFWGETSQSRANRKAVAGCEESGERKCRTIPLN